MCQTISAVYEDGVLKPLEKLVLGDHQQVRITIEPQNTNETLGNKASDPLDGLRAATGITDLAEHFDDYRLGRR